VTMLGADVEELRALATEFDAQATKLTGLATSVAHTMVGTSWFGSDADRFRGDWNLHLDPQLRQVAQELQRDATQLRVEADQQEQVSEQLGLAAGATVDSIGKVVSGWLDWVGKVTQPLLGLNVATTLNDFKLVASPVLSGALKVAGKVLGPVSVALGGAQMLSGWLQGDGFKVADGAISTVLAGGAIAAGVIVGAPAAAVIGAAGVAWGVAQYLSGDVPVTKRVTDAATWVGGQASSAASTVLAAPGKIIASLFGAPAAAAGW
jgi:hypothetical protein